MDDGRLEVEHGKLYYRDSTDDEEVRLLPHRKGADEPGPPGSDICDGPNTSDTQRDEWLLFRGLARSGTYDVEHHGTPTPLLPLERQILQEAEVTTPPKKRELTSLGAVRLSSLSYPPEGHEQCLRFFRMFGQGASVQTDGMMPGHMEMCWLTRSLGCSRIWRTSELRTGCCEHRGFHLWCVPLDRRRSQRRKCHGLVGRPVGNSTDRFLMLSAFEWLG